MISPFKLAVLVGVQFPFLRPLLAQPLSNNSLIGSTFPSSTVSENNKNSTTTFALGTSHVDFYLDCKAVIRDLPGDHTGGALPALFTHGHGGGGGSGSGRSEYQLPYSKRLGSCYILVDLVQAHLPDESSWAEIKDQLTWANDVIYTRELSTFTAYTGRRNRISLLIVFHNPVIGTGTKKIAKLDNSDPNVLLYSDTGALNSTVLESRGR